MSIRKNSSLLFFFIQIVCVLLLIWPAFWNGYPILTSDSGAYLASGHSSEVPIDRPIIYGLFTRHISLSWTVWLVIIAQSALFNYLIYLISKFFIKAKQASLIQLCIIALLAFVTGLGGYCSSIMADVFASMSLLSLFLLLLINKKEKKHMLLLVLIFAFSIVTHLSHIPLVVGELFLVVLFLWLFHRREIRNRMRRLILISTTIFAALFMLALINYSYGVGFKLSRTNNIILATRFIENGLANKYLKEACGEAGFNPPYKELCAYVDQFKRWPGAGYYLYDETSPLYEGGCLEKTWSNCWLVKNEAYGLLITDILSEPALRKEYFSLVLSGTLKQLITFEEPHLDPFKFPWVIERHFKSDLSAFENSNQFNGRIEFKPINTIENIVVILSTLLLLILGVIYWRKLSVESKLFLFIVLSSILFNAFLTSTLSNVSPRYQGRIIFLLPLGLLALSIKSILERRKLKEVSL